MIRGAHDGQNVIVTDYKEEDLEAIFRSFFKSEKFSELHNLYCQLHKFLGKQRKMLHNSTHDLGKNTSSIDYTFTKLMLVGRHWTLPTYSSLVNLLLFTLSGVTETCL